ncbi:MAG: chlorite dismutase family protein [Nitrospinae bacterium]|nr:chlorite dismutase family protein [Nitrospinota bacterium]
MADGQSKAERVFSNYLCFKVDPLWRRLPKSERDVGAKEFREAVQGAMRHVGIRSYLTTGFREDIDFFLWAVSKEAEPIQDLAVDIYRTGLGTYLQMTYSYFAMLRESPYAKNHINPPIPELGPCKYLVVYPFVKTREWYLMSLDARQGMMNEHIKVGHEFPSIKIHTSYSFGLDDQDFVVAFDTNSLAEFQDLVMRLRATEASRYTVRDTPMIVGVTKSLDEMLTCLGG